MLASGNFKLLFDKFGKNWYFITPDYAYGHSVADDYTKLLQNAGGKLLGNALAPLGTTDFSSYLIQARLAKPDVLMFLTAGDDLVNSLKQGVQFGLDKQMAFAGPYIEVEDLMAMPQAARIGWWAVKWWWDQPKQPHVAEFVATYKKMSGGKVPTARSWFGFVSLHSIAMAANKVKSIESLKVCRAMEGLVLPPEVALAPNNPFYRAEDHQLMLSEFVGYVLTDSVYPNLFQVTNIVPGATIALPPGQEGCKMAYPS
jgi:branched-chain amino acid transport system substrate-binding protein